MKPILFSGSMVRAILEDRKIMTRRVIKPQPCPEADRFVKFGAFSDSDFAARFGNESANAICDRKPKYRPGDILWVRETWYHMDSCKYCMCDDEPEAQDGCYVYRATHDADLLPWRPSIFIPREAARIFLRVTDVRVERVQEITQEDARREGCEGFLHINPLFGCAETIKNFENLWDGINAKRGYAWSTNPWVWAYSFERISKEEAERSVA